MQTDQVRTNKRIILASASPRRRELLSLITERFEVVTAEIDERACEMRMEEDGTPVLKVSENLAALKAKAVYDSLTSKDKKNTIVIGADTSVISDGVIYGKPEDREDAVRMLSSMSGKVHVVATGVALFTDGKKRVFTEKTHVEFYALDDFQQQIISDYCDSGSPYDKAGSYGIQDMGALLIKRIDGDYSNVVGLPVSKLARELSCML